MRDGADMWIRAISNKAKNARPRAAVRTAFDEDAIEIRMFSVSEGEFILLRFPENRSWLVGCGNTNAATRNAELANDVLAYLEEEDLTLNAIIACHAHIDHQGAVETLVRSRSPRIASPLTIYRAEDGWDGSTKWLGRYHTEVADAGAACVEVILKNAHLDVQIAPEINAHLFAGDGDGAYTSLFLQLRYRNARILFTGDTHRAYEAELLAQEGPEHFRCDVYKVTHHGSSSGTDPGAIAASEMAIAIASTGADGGHRLEPDTIERLHGPAGTERRILETLIHGDIILRTDGREYRKGVLYDVQFDADGPFAEPQHGHLVEAR